MQLTEGHLLQGGKYKIEKILGQGGFGITYLARQVNLDRDVAIKEFFMKDYCDRDESSSKVTVGSSGSRDIVAKYREKFVKEAKSIARLNHPNIVRIIDVFEENETAYYVMEYLSNNSLSRLVKKNGRFPEDEALKYIDQIASALEYIHARKMLHLDIKPSNILLDENGRCTLIDFGISKCYDDDGEQTSSTPVGKSKGYAPMEQYVAGGINMFTPATDIYSLGAVLYYLVTGQTPPDANEVYNDGLDSEHLQSVSPAIKAAIVSAMQPRRSDRPETIVDFIIQLKSYSNERIGTHEYGHDEEVTRVEILDDKTQKDTELFQNELGTLQIIVISVFIFGIVLSLWFMINNL